MKEKYEFDFNEIFKEFRSGKKLTGKGGLLALMWHPKTRKSLCGISNVSIRQFPKKQPSWNWTDLMKNGELCIPSSVSEIDQDQRCIP